MDNDEIRLLAERWLNEAVRTEADCYAYIKGTLNMLDVLHWSPLAQIATGMLLQRVFGLTSIEA